MNDIKKVTCPFCSLHCADLRVSFDGGRLAGIAPDCFLAEAGFRSAAVRLSTDQSAIRPHPTTLRTAWEWLREARQVLVVLSGGLDDETVSAAVRLARQFSAILVCDEDCSGSVLGLSMQTTGFFSSTLGDLRGLSQVVLCGVNPARTHPRLGEHLGRDLTIDSLILDPPNPLEALRWLRLAGSDLTEIIPPIFSEAAARVKAAPSGMVIFGMELLKAGQSITTELLFWLKDLNLGKRWYALYLAPAPNSTGVVETLFSETGYPGNMRFNQEGVDYSPRLWRADRLIQQGAMDLSILVGHSDSFSEETLFTLSQGRTILIDMEQPAWNPSLWLPSAQVGIDVPGCHQRLDGIPVNLQPVFIGQRTPIRDLLMELSREVPPA